MGPVAFHGPRRPRPLVCASPLQSRAIGDDPRPRAAVLRTARCWSARCWPVQPGAEAALDAAVHWSVPVEPVAAHPCAVRAHRRRAAGLRAAGRWSPGCRGACPVSSPCATGFSRSYAKPRSRTQSSAVVLLALPVVRNSARSYLRAPLRYDRAPSGTTARPRVRPRVPGYDRAPSGTTARPRVRPRAPTYDQALPGTTARPETPNRRHPPTPTAPTHEGADDAALLGLGF